MCSEIGHCGHTTVEVVVAVEKSFGRIARLVPGVRLIVSEGDTGGSGSVQSIYEGLVAKKILEPK